MLRIARWIGRNADGVIALVLAACLAVLAWADIGGIDQDNIDSAVLLILAVLAATLLRDRIRAGAMERDVSTVIARLDRLNTKVATAQDALEQASTLRVLRGEAISRALARAREDTDSWTFKGGTGTFTRAVTLPDVIRRAREGGRPLTIRLEILDPTNRELCEHYAMFQRSVSQTLDGTGEVWTVERACKESFATILAACWYRQRYRLLTVQVGLSSTVSTFRWDMSSRYLIMTQFITQKVSREPALLIERGSTYYDRFSTELLTSLEQCRQLPIEQAARAVPLGDEPSVEQVQKLFVALNLPLPSTYEDDGIREIIQKAIRAKNPYANPYPQP